MKMGKYARAVSCIILFFVFIFGVVTPWLYGLYKLAVVAGVAE